MTVALSVSRSGDVAVLSGVDTDAALALLCRSVAAGTAFADYPVLLVDLRHVPALSPGLRAAFDGAVHAALRRRQWVDIIPPGRSPGEAVSRARRGLRLVAGQRASRGASARLIVSALQDLLSHSPP